LLTHEQTLWKLIRENGYCWRGHYNRENKWTWEVEPDSAIVERIREHWKQRSPQLTKRKEREVR
jgi:hypothetical protein